MILSCLIWRLWCHNILHLHQPQHFCIQIIVKISDAAFSFWCNIIYFYTLGSTSKFYGWLFWQSFFNDPSASVTWKVNVSKIIVIIFIIQVGMIKFKPQMVPHNIFFGQLWIMWNILNILNTFYIHTINSDQIEM